MPRKIADIPKQCKDPNHNFPNMWCPAEDGVYEHECPTCGEKQQTTYITPSC